MFQALRHVYLSLLLASVACQGQPKDDGTASGDHRMREDDIPTATAPSSILLASPISTSRVSNGTCMSRTVNYITHTLPQQCLRTDRIATNGTQSPSINSVANITNPLVSAGTLAPLGNSQPISVQSVDIVTSPTISDTANTVIVTSESGTTTPNQVTETSTHLEPPEAAVATASQLDAEADPLLDNANFLSFEQWKKQNLAKTGQSPDNVGQERPQTEGRPRPGINNALDTLGEESEIDLDFSGFGGGAVAHSSHAGGEPSASPDIAETVASGQSTSAANKLRSKDAGKTCKERTNYASFDCSASMMKTNPECKSASSVLVENKDSYMLNTCTAKNKFFIVELCNDIHIDTIVLANYEFFSSIFRHFRVSVSDRYPVKMDKWRELGTFEARSTREVQAFLVEDPQIWARYLRIEFLSHYGSEYYCPVSLLRVHGKTMMQEFRQEEEMARGELSDEELAPELAAAPTSFAQEPLTSTDEAEKATIEAISKVDSKVTAILDVASSSDAGNSSSVQATESMPVPETAIASVRPESTTPAFDELTCATSHSTTSEPTSTVVGSLSSTSASSILGKALPISSSVSGTPVTRNASESESSSRSDMLATSVSAASTHEHVALPSSRSTQSSTVTTADSTLIAAQSTNTTSPSTLSSSTPVPFNTTRSMATASPSPQASSQESFFKSIHKRLQQLESNSTLSLQYIEEQSRILRDAFNKVEKRQISATTTFLAHLNSTVSTELQGFRQAYDQLWQSTVIELEGQREQYQREMLALSTRLTLVADELVWQKRMGIVQSTLLLLCLGLVLFARQGSGYLDMTLAQQLMTKSQAAFRTGWESEPNSPSPASRSPVSVFRRRLWRSSIEPANGAMSDGTDTRPETWGRNPEVEVEPPTPSDDDGQAEESGADDTGLSATQSQPATPGKDGAGLERPPSAAGESRPSRPSSPLRYE